MPDPPATEANREAATAEAAVTAGGAATDAGADTSSDVRSAAVAAAILRACQDARFEVVVLGASRLSMRGATGTQVPGHVARGTD